jgi:hypothetical protein
MTGVENRWQAMFGDNFVDRVSHARRRIDILQDVVKLESSDTVVLDQITRLARAKLTLVRVDRGEWDTNVRIFGSKFGNLIVRDSFRPNPALAIDREQAKGDFLLSVYLDDLGHFGPLARRLEIG